MSDARVGLAQSLGNGNESARLKAGDSRLRYHVGSARFMSIQIATGYCNVAQ